MKTNSIIAITFLVLLTSIVSCKKDHDIPTGKVFNSELLGDTIFPGSDTIVPGGDTIVPGGDTIVPGSDTIVPGCGGSHDHVDLGLPSGTLWATCNLGAYTPEDYGVYFAWGETRPKSIYHLMTYQYSNGNENELTKYCNNSRYGYNGFTDTLTTLLPEDDAATANWGSEWRMPTEGEWNELRNNTVHVWTIKNGVNGMLFTASNGNTLFLPAAGCRSRNLEDVGSKGYYWSSVIDTEKPDRAKDLYFVEYSLVVINSNRYTGRSVRAVRDNRKTN